MFGFGGGDTNRDRQDSGSNYGGPGEGVTGTGSMGGPGVNHSTTGGNTNRSDPGRETGGGNSTGDRDRQGPGNVGGGTSPGGTNHSDPNRETGAGETNRDRLGGSGGFNSVGDVGGLGRDIRSPGGGATPTGFAADGMMSRDITRPSISDLGTINGSRAPAPGPVGTFSPSGFTPTGFNSFRDTEVQSMSALDQMRQDDAAQRARASENASMAAYDRMQNEKRADMAAKARAAEDQSMSTYDKLRQTAFGAMHRAAEDAVTSTDTSALDRVLGVIRGAEGGVANPYNTLSGGKKADIENMTVREAVKFAGMPWSGKQANVLGGYQFKDTTLSGIAKQMGLMDAKMTPAVQGQLAQGLMQQRANDATVDGKIDVNKFADGLTQEWASLAAPSGISHYAANGIDKASISWSDTKALAQSLVDSGAVKPNGSVRDLAKGPEVTKQTETSFVDKFLTRTSFPMDHVVDPNMAHVVTAGGAPDASQTPGAVPNDAPPAGPKASVYGNKAEGPAPGAEYPDRPRSLGEQIMAGGIDVLTGVVSPGLGLANQGLGLITGKTIGTRAMDYIAGLDGEPGTFSYVDDVQGTRGGARWTGEIAGKTTADPKPKTKAEDFESKFLDKTKRPTPAEKWGEASSTYGSKEYT